MYANRHTLINRCWTSWFLYTQLFAILSAIHVIRHSETSGGGRAGKQIPKAICMRPHSQVREKVNKCIPGIKGHISRDCVCGCLAEEKAYAAVEALGVCAGGCRGCAGGQRALLQQGQRVGRTVTQGVGAAAQLLATIRINTVYQTIWKQTLGTHWWKKWNKEKWHFILNIGKAEALLSSRVN